MDVRFRFNLKILLVVVTLIAVGLGAYLVGQRNGERYGYRRGVRDTTVEWERQYAEQSAKIEEFEVERNRLVHVLQKHNWSLQQE